MAQPSRRSTLIDYCKRQLGAPLLEINIADEQTEDLLDDAIQYFQERHFNGVIQTFLKYKVRQIDIDRARGRGATDPVGIVTTTTSATIVGVSTTFSFEEDSNYLQMPNSVIGVNKLFHFDGSNTVTSNMFSVKYQLFLNDVAFNLGYAGILNYTMTKRYLTALMKRQWGQNLIKFQGVKLPGGVELNGRQIYDDGQRELDIIREQMSNTYELPPLDFIG